MRIQTIRGDGKAMTAWITRQPSADELERYRLMISLVNAQKGFARQWKNNIPYPDFQLMEEVFAEAFGGRSCRGKDVFDVLVQDSTSPQRYFGIQLKMKGAFGPGSSYATLSNTGQMPRNPRLYVEMSNPQNATIAASGTTQQELLNHTANVGTAGQGIMNWIQQKHNNAGQNHLDLPQGCTIDVASSVTILMTWAIHNGVVRYWLHSFAHELPAMPIWAYTPGANSKSIRGFESQAQFNTGIQSIDWSFSSGGQIKWYPLASTATQSYGPFDLEPTANQQSLEAVARVIFPNFP
jgi:hypothetical protein